MKENVRKKLVGRFVTIVVCLVVKMHFLTKIERRLICLYFLFLKEKI